MTVATIVFFCIPAQGHTNPTLGVVRELTARGHRVRYYSYEPLREKIEAAGAEFVSCDDYDMERRLTPKEAVRLGKDLAFSTKTLVDTTLALDEKVCRDMEALKPECIVADSMAVWGKAVALKLGIPFVCSTTTFAFNRHSARIMKQGPGELLRMLLSMPKIQKDIRRLQERGYPVKSVLDIIQNDENTHTVVYTSREFQPCAETFSDRYAFVGPSIRPAGEGLPKLRQKRIYLSMGTVNNDMLPLYRQFLEAFRESPYEVILSVGDLVPLSAFGDLPEHIRVFPRVDQIAVLQQTDVFFSHCGMNSASESLYFGVPLAMLPKTPEQGAVAERISQLGAGLRLTRTDPQSLRQAAEVLLADPQYRQAAGAIRQGFLDCPGARGAADKIETVLSGS